VIGYLDFLAPAAYYNGLEESQKEIVTDFVVAAETDKLTTYISAIKDPNAKAPLDNALAILQERGGDIFTVSVKLDGKLVMKFGLRHLAQTANAMSVSTIT
jgi:hypothetical protein